MCVCSPHSLPGALGVRESVGSPGSGVTGELQMIGSQSVAGGNRTRVLCFCLAHLCIKNRIFEVLPWWSHIPFRVTVFFFKLMFISWEEWKSSVTSFQKLMFLAQFCSWNMAALFIYIFCLFVSFTADKMLFFSPALLFIKLYCSWLEENLLKHSWAFKFSFWHGQKHH